MGACQGQRWHRENVMKSISVAACDAFLWKEWRSECDVTAHPNPACLIKALSSLHTLHEEMNEWKNHMRSFTILISIVSLAVMTQCCLALLCTEILSWVLSPSLWSTHQTMKSCTCICPKSVVSCQSWILSTSHSQAWWCSTSNLTFCP